MQGGKATSWTEDQMPATTHSSPRKKPRRSDRDHAGENSGISRTAVSQYQSGHTTRTSWRTTKDDAEAAEDVEAVEVTNAVKMPLDKTRSRRVNNKKFTKLNP